MNRKQLIKPLLFLGSLLLLSGCGSDSAKTYSNSSYAATSQSSSEGDYGWYEESSDEMDMAATDTTEDAEPAEAGSGIPDEALNDQANRKLIKTVSLSMETQAFDEMKAQLEEAITSFGGYVESSDYNIPTGSYSKNRFYSITVRVPSDKLDEFTDKVGNLGTITNKSENVEDVTLDYVDKEAYLESLRTEYNRVTELLEEATDLDQILALESKLSDLRYEINSYESRLRTYDNLIDYSTVYLYISEVQYVTDVQPTVGSRISNGFRDSLLTIRDFFVNLIVFLLANLPILLLIAIFIVLIVVIVRKIPKKIRNKDKKKPSKRKEENEEDKENGN